VKEAMGSGRKTLTQDGLDNILSGYWVSRPLHMRIKISSKKKISFNFIQQSGQKNIFGVLSKNTWVRAGLALYLLRVRSMFGSGQVMTHLFTKGRNVMQ